MIFDEVIIERPAVIPADLQFDFPSANVLFATKLVQDNNLAHLECKMAKRFGFKTPGKAF